jgi:ribose/xylose/arabinose/galactoside ABC-type transport system permease subunit
VAHADPSKLRFPPAKKPSPWKRLVAAQESGLVLVIALVMAALTYFGGEKSKPFRVDVPAGAEVSRNADFFIVKHAGRVDMYARDSGWLVRTGGKGDRIGRTEQKDGEVVALGDDAVVEQTDGAIVVTQGGVRTEYPRAAHWELQTDTDGTRRVVEAIRASWLADVPGAPQEGHLREEGGQIILERPDGTVWYPQQVPWRLIEESETSRSLIGSITANRFFEKENLVLLTTKASYFAVIAVGMTAIIILAGIDLSVGSIYAVAAIVGAMALQRLDQGASAWVSVPVALLVCTGVGALLGMANGAMIVGLRLHPFIITLGTMAIYRGLVLLLTGGQTVSDLPESIQKDFFKAEYAGVYPTLTVIMIVVALIGTFVLHKTVLGRRVYAIGGNETAAFYAGVPVGRVKLVVYTLGGLLAGLSACMEVGYNATASVGAGQGYELNVIAAAVIGGASLSGGRGSAIGAVLGAILVSLIDNAMVILDINQNYNQIVMGAAIVIAVAVDQLKRRYLKN